MRGHRLDSFVSGQGLLVVPYEHGNEVLGSIKEGEYLTSCMTMSFSIKDPSAHT
jgi:hypothetical protein